jgi:hypothetical protein
MPRSTHLYFSYLLRLWHAGDGSKPQWRASLQDPRTGDLRGFDSLETLFDFLKQKIREEFEENKREAVRNEDEQSS